GRRHTRSYGDWSSDVCSSDLAVPLVIVVGISSKEGGVNKAVPGGAQFGHKAVSAGAVLVQAIAVVGGERGLERVCRHREVRRTRSEEHMSELQSPYDLVCRLL